MPDLNASDIEAHVREVLGDSSKRDSMIALGREQLKKFNWSDIIEQTLKVQGKWMTAEAYSW